MMDGAALVRLLKANGLDPDNIPARAVQITAGTIRFRTYVREFDPVDPTGPGLLVADDEGKAQLTEWREVPLRFPDA